ncbi:Integrase zinc binding domain [Popillia japonica]|uniref:RNA-directed DNA polymerase n=1 Tax=Popillia japonica TaxID=7064 RepID=A0AAW1MLN2_POPJA
MEVEYRPGEKMRHVDALSRNPLANVGVVNMAEGDWFLTVQLQDDKAQKIVAQLAEGVENKDLKADYKVTGGQLYRRTKAGDRLYVPAIRKFNLLRMYHDDTGHPGVRRCLELIQQNWFPKMGRFVDKYVTSCLRCALSKGEYGRKAGCLHPIEKAAIPFDTVHIDHLGPFSRSRRGNSYVLVEVDGFTRFTLIKATKTVSTAETVTKLRKVFGEFGYPRRMISETVTKLRKVFGEFGYPRRMISDRSLAFTSKAANGQVERQNRTILDALATGAEDELSWDEKLPDVMWGMNNMANSATDVSPAQLMFTLYRGHMVDLSEGVKAANDNGASCRTRRKSNSYLRRKSNSYLIGEGGRKKTSTRRAKRYVRDMINGERLQPNIRKAIWCSGGEQALLLAIKA